MLDRVVGRYSQNKKGPLLVVLGAMHGNEPAGVIAMQKLFELLKNEPLENPDFSFNGTFLGLIGHLEAYQQNKRFINRDLNRQWQKTKIDEIAGKRFSELDSEEIQIFQILNHIEREIEAHSYDRCIILDLHTTSSKGGIFTISSEYPDSLKIALELHAPVIKGMLNGLKGTTLHYFINGALSIPTTAVTFESGQHTEELSSLRAIAAIINCMRTIGCVDGAHVENKHDELLITYSKDLPECSELVYRHGIEESDNFEMLPGYKNFQEVKEGQKLAKDKDGFILAKCDGRILMPLYQKQGEDGFFIVKESSL